MIVGFTGTRNGMSVKQAREFRSLMQPLFGVITAFHHGGCIGSDAEAHAMMYGHAPIEVWPGPSEDMRAIIQTSTPDVTVHEPMPYLDRNREIVDACDLLVVCPAHSDGPVSGGTWYTYRQAKQAGRPVLMLWP